MKKEEMIKVLAEIATTKNIEIEYDPSYNYSFEENFKTLSMCDDLSPEITTLFGKTLTHKSEIEYMTNEVSDNELISCVFKITNIKEKKIGYIRFSGRYSSWESSFYNSCEVVYPRKIKQTIYESKLEMDISE